MLGPRDIESFCAARHVIIEPANDDAERRGGPGDSSKAEEPWESRIETT